jgi:hypothetical protein
MPSLNPPLTKDDFINSRWQDVVNNSERKECLAYNMAFWKKEQEALEESNHVLLRWMAGSSVGYVQEEASYR